MDRTGVQVSPWSPLPSPGPGWAPRGTRGRTPQGSCLGELGRAISRRWRIEEELEGEQEFSR